MRIRAATLCSAWLAILVLLAPAASIAGGKPTTLDEACGYERVYCLIVVEDARGRVALVFVHLGGPVPYVLCVKRVEGRNRVCGRYRTTERQPEASAGIVYLRRDFPFRGPGSYRATWRVVPRKRVLGHPLQFDLPVKPPQGGSDRRSSSTRHSRVFKQMPKFLE